ncbi:hypothetical protein MAE02_64470 [Microvirga aerophila]|uniref:Uncharacterized protein n=2 Tax=Microvirga aerophila TaxID=670291 RepID=A0A512C3H9_9HYPH|nr:hypothetical protein MAE02_64470 [Microvirga aerophila]
MPTDNDNATSSERARNLAAALIAAQPPQERLLTSIYQNQMAHPLSRTLEDVLLHLDRSEDEPVLYEATTNSRGRHRDDES